MTDVKTSNSNNLTNTSQVFVSKIIDDDKNTQLHYSCASGKLEDVVRDLETNKKIDVENYLGWTPLMMACRNDHMDVVELLLSKGADASKKNKFGFSVFMMSIAAGNVDLVVVILKHLLSGGVSRLSMEKQFSPIALAVLCSSKKITKYLIDHSFNINAATITGITPLMFAAAMENCPAFTLLLKKGADVSMKNILGYTAHAMIEERNKESEPPHPQYLQVQQPNLKPPESIVINKQAFFQHHHHQQQQLPVIVLSPHHVYQYSPNGFNSSKSSNIMTPHFCVTPNVTPIAPVGMVPQMFFPQEFSPGHNLLNPMGNVYTSGSVTPDLLNYRLNQHLLLTSPMPQQMM